MLVCDLSCSRIVLLTRFVLWVSRPWIPALVIRKQQSPSLLLDFSRKQATLNIKKRRDFREQISNQARQVNPMKSIMTVLAILLMSMAGSGNAIAAHGGHGGGHGGGYGGYGGYSGGHGYRGGGGVVIRPYWGPSYYPYYSTPYYSAPYYATPYYPPSYYSTPYYPPVAVWPPPRLNHHHRR